MDHYRRVSSMPSRDDPAGQWTRMLLGPDDYRYAFDEVRSEALVRAIIDRDLKPRIVAGDPLGTEIDAEWRLDQRGELYAIALRWYARSARRRTIVIATPVSGVAGS
jgi:hypothetical protein